ncbi:MAG: ATP-grasp domain-containing protein [Epulopiscium sp.]|nr:ATP-grasp domain-containing protein [Candidatus Epulonipiscium sp.]
MILESVEKVGIMGGGINAALLCLEAHKKGIKTTIVDQDLHCPASSIADEHLVSPLNKTILLKLIQRTDVIVFANKLKSISDYSPLLKEKAKVYPQIEILETLSSRRRFLWKMEQLEIPTIKYKILEDEIGLLDLLREVELPVSITKYYKDKYDEFVLTSDEDMVDLLVDKDRKVNYWLVEEIPLDSIELSVGISRDRKNKMYDYSVCEDLYDGDTWIQGHVPARITKTLQRQAIALARRTIRRLDATGTFAVNIVLSQEGELIVRDVQPFALASAIYTEEGCGISQYDHLIRIILGLPLYSAEFEGVVFSYLEKESANSGARSMKNMLEKQGSNMYSFKGKTYDSARQLYTFKADSWEDLEQTLNS